MYANKNTSKKRNARKKLNLYESYEKDSPKLPDFTCPLIDEVVEWASSISFKMEEIRKMNSELRDSAEYWKSACEEMQDKINEYQSLTEEIKNVVNKSDL
jgi:cyclopropane fatty-acyl-phospholipid synthase-like methyltransferase